MELTLQPEEARVLKRVLAEYLVELRGEISNTENYDLRESLKHDEMTLKAILARLDQAETTTAESGEGRS